MGTYCLIKMDSWNNFLWRKVSFIFTIYRLKEGVDLSRIPEWRSGFICSIWDEIDGCKIIVSLIISDIFSVNLEYDQQSFIQAVQ